MKVTLLVGLMWITGSALAQNEISGKVVNVIDGNTFEIIGEDQQRQKLSLFGIDCPEVGQDYADEAKKVLKKLILNETVSIQIKGKDRWGNYLAIVVKGNTDPRIELLKEGLAWTAEKNPIPELEEHRLRAKEKERGIWKLENPTPPWIYRRQQSMMQAKSS